MERRDRILQLAERKGWETFPPTDWRRSLNFPVESPPEFMASTLAHLKAEHGGARALLRSIGLTDPDLDLLVDALTEPAGPAA